MSQEIQVADSPILSQSQDSVPTVPAGDSEAPIDTAVSPVVEGEPEPVPDTPAVPSGPVYPIRAFFANYPAFEYDPSTPFLQEFKRMESDLHWDRKQRETAREELRQAMVKQFNAMYGTSADDLASWQLLCTALGVKPVPDDIKSCRRQVKATHVNIVDFIEDPLSGKPVRTFKSEAQLARYTKDTKKYFPRDDINSGSLLRTLLRQIMSPQARRPGAKSNRQQEPAATEPEPQPAEVAA